MITTDNIYAEAVKVLPPEDIEHHGSDLYIRITPESRKLIDQFQYKRLMGSCLFNTFTSYDGSRWYDLAFCYSPYYEKMDGNF